MLYLLRQYFHFIIEDAESKWNQKVYLAFAQELINKIAAAILKIMVQRFKCSLFDFIPWKI